MANQQAMDFWYEFDNTFLWRRTPEVNAAFEEIFALNPDRALDSVVDLFRGSYAAGTYPESFNASVRAAAKGFHTIATIQLSVMDQHFRADSSALRTAFEDFGQGTLFDPRRAQSPQFHTVRIHMMDGTPDNWAGYHRWHAFIRAGMASGADARRWSAIMQNVALAWSIQTEANPVVDSPNNPGLAPARLAMHRQRWLSANDEELDRVFAAYPMRAPAIGPMDMRALNFKEQVAQPAQRYAYVRKILDDAAGGSHPIHEGRGRFWDLPLAEFVKLEIYGVQLIAGVGPDRAKRSGLIEALTGVGRFGPGGMPRMPLNRAPVSPANIALIEKWIEDDCPE
jgi:hypothetical protein